MPVVVAGLGDAGWPPPPNVGPDVRLMTPRAPEVQKACLSQDEAFWGERAARKQQGAAGWGFTVAREWGWLRVPHAGQGFDGLNVLRFQRRAAGTSHMDSGSALLTSLCLHAWLTPTPRQGHLPMPSRGAGPHRGCWAGSAGPGERRQRACPGPSQPTCGDQKPPPPPPARPLTSGPTRTPGVCGTAADSSHLCSLASVCSCHLAGGHCLCLLCWDAGFKVEVVGDADDCPGNET